MAKRGIKTQADIVALDPETSRNGLRFVNSGTTYFPTFSFTDPDGEIRVVKPVVGFSIPFRVGETREILYLPIDPNSPVRLAGRPIFKGMGALILYVTTPMILMILMILYSGWRGQSADNQRRQRRDQLAWDRRARAKARKGDSPWAGFMDRFQN